MLNPQLAPRRFRRQRLGQTFSNPAHRGSILPWACAALLALSIAGNTQTVTVTVNRRVINSTSSFQGGESQIDNSLDYPWGSNNQTAVNSARAVIANSAAYVNQDIMGWGVDDPWPNSSDPGPTNWSSLDTHMTTMLNTGQPICITLCEAPWWMKGILNADGTTTVLTSSDEWTSAAYASRILDNKMSSWLTLVSAVAKRYMAAPYNVRTFQVWNELKGYWDPQSGVNHWDYNNSAGVPSGPNAKHGYTYMYNQVYSTLMSAATSLGISTSSIKVGGPYVVMDSYSAASKTSNPSSVTGPWGVLDQRPLDVITYWLANKTGGQFVTIDGSNINKDGTEITDCFTCCQKYATINNWIRTQPGGSTIPIWWAEWYTYPTGLTSSDQTNRAVGAYAAYQHLTSGASTPLIWGGTSASAAAPPLYTDTTSSTGGQPTLWAGAFQNLNDLFGPGTPIFSTSSSAGNIVPLAGDTSIMLVNKGSSSATVSMQGLTYSLAAYDVQFINSVVYQAESLTVPNYHSAAGGTARVLPSDPNMSASDGSILDSNNVGDYVTYLIPNVAAGSYDVRVGLKDYNARGQFQLQVGRADNFSGTESNVGPVVDEYSATVLYTEVDLGTWSPGSTSDKWFRFNVVGKNSASGGSSYNYALAFDYITLTPE